MNCGTKTSLLKCIRPDYDNEVAEYHEALLAYQKDIRKAIDDAPGAGVSEEEYILDTLLPLGLEHQPEITDAIAAMDPAVRERMADAGCLDEGEDGTEPVAAQAELTVGEAMSMVQDDPSQSDRFTFQAERGQRYFVEVVRDTLPDFVLTLPIPEGQIGGTIISSDEERELSLRWEASVSGAHHFLVSGDSGGSYSVAVLPDLSPPSPSNVRFAWEGSSIRVSWDPVDGANHYNVYHDDFFPEGCELERDGSTEFCDKLAVDVAGTYYIHDDLDREANYGRGPALAASGNSCSHADGHSHHRGGHSHLPSCDHSPCLYPDPHSGPDT